jgi:MMPL family
MAAPLSIQDGAKYDLMIPGIAALSLILLIMMILTRSLVAAFVIVGTVALDGGGHQRGREWRESTRCLARPAQIVLYTRFGLRAPNCCRLP